MDFYYKGKKALEAGVPMKELFALPVRERIGRAKYTPEEEVENLFNDIENQLNKEMEELVSKEGE